MTMVAGNEVCRDGHVNAVDEGELRSRLETIRTRLASLG